MKYIPYIITAVLTFGICILVDYLSRRRAKGKPAVRRVKPAKRTTFFGTVLTFLGFVTVLFYSDRFGAWAIAAGAFVFLFGIFLLLTYFCTGITYDDEGCCVRVIGRKTKHLRYADITGQTALYTRGGVCAMLQFGSDAIDLYESMTGANDFLAVAYEGYLTAKGLTREDCPPPNPESMLWFQEPAEE